MLERSTRLIDFLMKDLGVEAERVAIAQRVAKPNLDPLHLVLWQLGLLSSQQLEHAFDWLEQQY